MSGAAWFGAALQMMGGGMKAQGQYESGKYNKEIADMNARVYDAKSDDALRRGAEEEELHRTKVRRTTGSQRAALAAQGQNLEEGSAVEIQQDTAYLGELDAITIRNNAAREAWGYRVQAEDQRSRGRLAEMEGRIGGTSTLLTSVGSGLSSGMGGG